MYSFDRHPNEAGRTTIEVNCTDTAILALNKNVPYLGKDRRQRNFAVFTKNMVEKRYVVNTNIKKSSTPALNLIL